MQVSSAFTLRPFSFLAFDTYRMGFIGDMHSQLFFDDDVELWSPLGLAGRVAYMFFGFVVMVSMANIFIQVMGEAYDKNSQEVDVAFNRARAFRGLQFQMYLEVLDDLTGGCFSFRSRRVGCSGRAITWFCCPSHGC